MGRSLRALLDAHTMRVCGVMSGTSTDGLDIAVVDIAEQNGHLATTLQLFLTQPYNAAMRETLFALQRAPSLDLLARANVAFGVFTAHAIIAACRAKNVAASSIDLIGSHGHTVVHAPTHQSMFDVNVGGTMQIGSPAAIAAHAGIVTVGDFRVADVALGGQGAPLMPYVDYRLLAHATEGRVALNIGGIANVTLLPAGARPEQVTGYDTGPGNMVIDALCRRLFDRPFDPDGRIAREAHGVDERLLAQLLDDAYFAAPPPKSTGRERYGDAFVGELIDTAAKRSIDSGVLLRTATELTARTIAAQVDRAAGAIGVRTLIVSGGGARNGFLVERLETLLPRIAVRASDTFGLPIDAKDAIGFAVLAFECVRGRAASLPSVTGASRAAVLGTICQ